MNNQPNPIKVLIVDDSALIRSLLTKIFSSAPHIEVVGTAMDPYAAREKIKQLNPDVITLDIEMPKMDGLTFLRNLMRLRPMPVVMFSSLTQKNADATVQALELGAVDFVSKPTHGLTDCIDDLAEELIDKVTTAAQVNPAALRPARTVKDVEQRYTADAVIAKTTPRTVPMNRQPLVAIGSSTGGVEALLDVLSQMPASAPAIVISQHIPSTFSESFANRADKHSAMTVFHAQDGQQIVPGHVYIAPGGTHLIVTTRGDNAYCKLSDGPPVNRHKPSVDVMFRSVAQTFGKRAMGVILTGMGDDGAAGLKELHDVGCFTIAQDKESSVVWGMPGSAVKLGAADDIIGLDKIPARILKWQQECGQKIS
jgi:two-component system chemotaxis response regulator CheB